MEKAAKAAFRYCSSLPFFVSRGVYWVIVQRSSPKLDFGFFTQVAHQRFEGNLRIVLRNAFNHRFLLRFWQGAGFHFIQRQQNDVALRIGR